MRKYQTKRVMIGGLVVSVMITILAWIVLVGHENKIHQYNYDESQNADMADFNFIIDYVTYKRDRIPTTEDYIEIYGWITKKNEEIKSVETHILLRNQETGECYLLPTTIIERTDITDYFYDENYQYNYDESGFLVKIPHSKKINTDMYDYEIMALYVLNGKSYILSAGTTIKTWESYISEDEFEMSDNNEEEICNYNYDESQVADMADFNFIIDYVTYKRDKIPTTEDYIEIYGWIAKKDEEIKSMETHILLRNQGTGECYLLPTTIIERTDITDYFYDENYQYNYDESGFLVKIPHSKKINTDMYDYEIMALYVLNEKSYILSAGTTIKTWESYISEDDFAISDNSEEEICNYNYDES